MNLATETSTALGTAAGVMVILAALGYLIAIFATYDDNRMAGVYSTGLLASALMMVGAAMLSVSNLAPVTLIAGSVFLGVGAFMLIVMTIVAAIFAQRVVRAALA